MSRIYDKSGHRQPMKLCDEVFNILKDACRFNKVKKILFFIFLKSKYFCYF